MNASPAPRALALVSTGDAVYGRLSRLAGAPAVFVHHSAVRACREIVDFAAGIALRGFTPAQILGNFATPAGAIYAVSLVAFEVRVVELVETLSMFRYETGQACADDQT